MEAMVKVRNASIFICYKNALWLTVKTKHCAVTKWTAIRASYGPPDNQPGRTDPIRVIREIGSCRIV